MFDDMRASILHADLDSFYASVEQRDEPGLRGRPVVVGGGVVLAASYEAKAYGVRTAMGGHLARRLCPHAVVVRPRMRAYSDASKAVFDIFRTTSPFVEGMSIDEAFLDVGGLRRLVGPARVVAEQLRARVRVEAGLPITIGVARTKFLAKVASGVAKPDGLLVVDPDRERDFLHPLPVTRLWGVGTVTAAKLNRLGIEVVADVARLEEANLVCILGGAAGRHLHALSQLRDPRPVDVARRRRSVGAQRALGRSRTTRDDVEVIVLGLVHRVMGRLRSGGRAARTVTLRARFDDMERISRAASLPQATQSTAEVLAALRRLVRTTWPVLEERGVTLVGISLSNLEPADSLQLTLPFERRDRSALDRTVDAIRDRFGSSAVGAVSMLRHGPGLEMPMLPDPDEPP